MENSTSSTGAQLLPTTSEIDFSLVISIIALLVAAWAANETREARLDSKRMQLRGDTLAYIQEVRSVVNTFNCYGLVKGAKMEGKDDFMRFLEDHEISMREGISQLDNFGASALAIYKKNLNAVKGQSQNKINTILVEIRNSWDRDLREKADSVCKLN